MNLIIDRTREEIISSFREKAKHFDVDIPHFPRKILNIIKSAPEEFVPEKSKFAFHVWINQIFQEIVSTLPLRFLNYDLNKTV
jgi:hypothetical protein